MAFVRFIVPDTNPDSGVSEGIIQAAHRPAEGASLAEHDRQTLHELLTWIGANLAVPPRFNTARSKGHYRRKSRGISWLRDTATEPIARMRSIATILREHAIDAQMITAERVGYIVYEDEHQIVAEPLADTRTS